MPFLWATRTCGVLSWIRTRNVSFVDLRDSVSLRGPGDPTGFRTPTSRLRIWSPTVSVWDLSASGRTRTPIAWLRRPAPYRWTTEAFAQVGSSRTWNDPLLNVFPWSPRRESNSHPSGCSRSTDPSNKDRAASAIIGVNSSRLSLQRMPLLNGRRFITPSPEQPAGLEPALQRWQRCVLPKTLWLHGAGYGTRTRLASLEG